MQRIMEALGEETLKYWGFSYARTSLPRSPGESGDETLTRPMQLRHHSRRDLLGHVP